MNTRATHLQVKVINLADEAKTIRRKEAEALRKARKSSALGFDASDQYRLYHSLNGHRRGIVRDAARRNHLALACVRGRPYAEVERHVRDKGEASRAINEAFKIAVRFGCRTDDAEKWAEDAKNFLKGQSATSQAA